MWFPLSISFGLGFKISTSLFTIKPWCNFKQIMVVQLFWGIIFYLFGNIISFISCFPVWFISLRWSFYIMIFYLALLVCRGLSTWRYFRNIACWVGWLESACLFLITLTWETLHAQCAGKCISELTTVLAKVCWQQDLRISTMILYLKHIYFLKIITQHTFGHTM